MSPTVDMLDDAELVRRIAAGSRHDEAELVRRFTSRVRLYGRRHLRDDQAVADLVQEVMAVVIEAVRAGRVEAPERIRQFILGTCRFVVWRVRRGEHKRGEAAELARHELSIVEPTHRPVLDLQRLEQCLGQLPARDRKIIYLSFSEDRSAQEIGEAMTLSESNVRVIRHRALARLRACLDGERA